MRKSASPRPKKISAARAVLNGSIGAALAYLVIPAPGASAATFTWAGGGADGNWTTSGNFTEGTPANTGSDFIFTGTTGTLTGSIGTITSVSTITYNSGAGAFTGNSSASNATLTLAGDLTNNATNTQTLAAPIVIASARTITVGTGGTMVFGSSSTAYAHTINSVSTSTVTFTGAGELKYLTSTAGSLVIGETSSTNLTMTGLGTFSVNTGTLRIGSNTVSTAMTVTLAGTNNITATTLNLGFGSGNLTGNATLRLGTTNTINVDNINLGGKRSSGTMDMNGGSGSVTIRGAAGGTTKAALMMGNYNTSPGAYNPTGIIDFTGATQVDAKFSTVVLGQFTTGGVTAALVMRGNLTIDGSTSSVTADTIRVGYTAGGNVLGTGTRQEAQGNLVIKNGTVTISGGSGLRLGESVTTGTNTISVGNVSVTGGSLSVTGGFLMGSVNAGTGAASNARAVLSITGGTVTAGGNMTTNNARSTLTLNGGTLDMGGFSIGTSTQAIGSNGGAITWSSGTLKNVSAINSSAGMSKGSTGTLTLDGTNTWTGTTAVTAGKLVVLKSAALPNQTTSGMTTVAAAAELRLNAGGTDEFSSSDLNNVVTNTTFADNTSVLRVTSATSTAPTITSSITQNLSFEKYGTGSLTLSGASSSFNGTVLVNDGDLILASNNAAGATSGITVGNVSSTSPRLLLSGAVTIDRAVTMASASGINITPVIGSLTDNNATFSGGITANRSFQVTSAAAGSNKLSITGGISAVSGTKGVTFTAGNVEVATTGISDGGGSGFTVSVTGGATTLSATNAYTGATSVKGGALVVSGSLTGSAVTVGDSASLSTSAVLSGSGSISSAVTIGAASSNDGAAVDPGNGVASVSGGVVTGNGVTGTLTTGDFTLTSGAHMALQLGGTTAGTGYDQISASSLSLAGDLQGSLINGYTPGGSDLLFIAINTGGSAVTGAFSNAADLSYLTIGGQQWQITYSADSGTNSFTGGNDVALLAVPEPGAFVSLLGGFVTLLGFQRRRRQS